MARDDVIAVAPQHPIGLDNFAVLELEPAWCVLLETGHELRDLPQRGELLVAEDACKSNDLEARNS